MLAKQLNRVKKKTLVKVKKGVFELSSPVNFCYNVDLISVFWHVRIRMRTFYDMKRMNRHLKHKHHNKNLNEMCANERKRRRYPYSNKIKSNVTNCIIRFVADFSTVQTFIFVFLLVFRDLIYGSV